MPEPVSFFEKMFERAHRIIDRVNGRWDLHANRRTVIILLIVGSIAALSYVYVIQPPESFPVRQLVSITEGQSLSQVARNLQDQGVVRSALALRIYVKLLGDEKNIHAGDYLFKEPRDFFSVARALIIGAYGLEPIRIRIPEGATTKEMSAIFGNQFERFKVDNFLAQAPEQEGYLFPDTYFFLPNVNEKTVIQTMRQNFDQHLATIQPPVASSTHSLAEIITMASIIEREARISSDRRKISGVLWNRLARGMALQVDVTFLYTIGKGTFQLTMKDLMTDSPYNTYMNKGLPPTPIGSPSLDSINAALNPIPSDNLYYLADRNGVTYFSKTYAEHLRKKHLYLGSY